MHNLRTEYSIRVKVVALLEYIYLSVASIISFV